MTHSSIRGGWLWEPNNLDIDRVLIEVASGGAEDDLFCLLVLDLGVAGSRATAEAAMLASIAVISAGVAIPGDPTE